jgi:RNA polymerase sigma-70 factor (ECF subfamily)
MARMVMEVASRHAPIAAFAELDWAELVGSVHRQMRSLVGPIAELEDLTQIALEQVLRSIDRFEGRAQLSTFTYRVCANVALHHFRWWRRFLRRFEPGHADVTDTVPTGRSDATEQMIANERTRRLHRALDRLDASKRVTLVLADLEELPGSRVAEILGIPEPTVRSRLRAARMELHQILQRDPLFSSEAVR